jgi:cytochrome c556
LRKSASADLFSDQVSDDEAQHGTRTRPANFENDFTNESETAIFAAALEELRFDFNSAAAAAAATLAAELDEFSDDCSV